MVLGQASMLAPGIVVLAKSSAAILHELGCRVSPLLMTLRHTPHPTVAAGAVCPQLLRQNCCATLLHSKLCLTSCAFFCSTGALSDKLTAALSVASITPQVLFSYTNLQHCCTTTLPQQLCLLLQLCCSVRQANISLACGYNHSSSGFRADTDLQHCCTAILPQHLCLLLQHCCSVRQAYISLACSYNHISSQIWWQMQACFSFKICNLAVMVCSWHLDAFPCWSCRMFSSCSICAVMAFNCKVSEQVGHCAKRLYASQVCNHCTPSYRANEQSRVVCTLSSRVSHKGQAVWQPG